MQNDHAENEDFLSRKTFLAIFFAPVAGEIAETRKFTSSCLEEAKEQAHSHLPGHAFIVREMNTSQNNVAIEGEFATDGAFYVTSLDQTIIFPSKDATVEGNIPSDEVTVLAASNQIVTVKHSETTVKIEKSDTDVLAVNTLDVNEIANEVLLACDAGRG